MGGKGGGGGGNATSMMQMQMQMQEAENAKKKEAERKARIEQGMTAINQMFEGKPIMGTRKKNIDFSGLTDKAGVGGYKVKTRTGTSGGAAGGSGYNGMIPAAGAAGGGLYYGSDNLMHYDDGKGTIAGPMSGGPEPGGGGGAGYIGPTAQPGGGTTPVQTVEGYDLVDANGNVVASGKSIDDLKKFKAQEDETYDTGEKEGGIGEGLYSRYRKAQKDYYFPALATQYQDAKKKLLFDHINAGTTLSSMSGDNIADVEGQNVTNTSQINSQIEDSVGALKRQVASDKAALINQLYATEDPTMAANAATTKVGAINTQQPALSPIGEFFKLAAIGGGSALQGFGNASTYGNVQPYRGINTGTGKTYQS